MSVIEISKKIDKKAQAEEKALKESERIKFMAVQLVLNAYEVLGLSEVNRGYWWLYNYINNSIKGFFEHNIGVTNVPTETKKEALEWATDKLKKLEATKAVAVDKKKTEKEAQAMIIKIRADKTEKTKNKKPCQRANTDKASR